MASTVVVVGAVFERNGEYLACRRSSGKTNAGLWEFPGGKVEQGESREAALTREIWEELGVHVRVGALVDRSTTRTGSALIDLSTFKVAPAERFPVASTDHDQLRWVKASDLPTLIWAAPDLPTVSALMIGTPKAGVHNATSPE